MDKRTFIRQLGLLTTGMIGGVSFLQSCTAGKLKVPPGSWVWYSTGKKNRKEVLEDLNAMVERGFEGVHIQASKDLLHELLPHMKNKPLRIHAWIITMMVGDPEIIEEHHDWYAVSRGGESSADHPPYVPYYKWLCPVKTEVIDYNLSRVDDLCALKGLEGIHLDYIRYPDVILPVGLWEKYDLVQDREYPEFDFCYCDDCRKKFRAESGKDPLKLPDPPSDPQWRQFRYDAITRMVNTIATRIHQQGKKLSAAVFPTPSIAKKLVRQEWTMWDLDQVHPMIYHNFYNKPPEWIQEATREGVEALSGKFPLYSGVFVPELTPEDMAKVYSWCRRGNADGVTLFNWNSMREDQWKAFQQ